MTKAELIRALQETAAPDDAKVVFFVSAKNGHVEADELKGLEILVIRGKKYIELKD